MAEKKQIILAGVTIGDMVAEGKCIVKLDEVVYFVEGVVPGDVCDLRVIKKKRNYGDAILHQLLTPSPLRITAFCQHFGTCGGCKWQNLSYDQQLKFKQQQVVDQLQRLGKVTWNTFLPIIGSERVTQYRNKLEYSFSNKRWLDAKDMDQRWNDDLQKNALGFHVPGRFDKVLDVSDCQLLPEPNNAIREAVKAYALDKGYSFYDLREKVGLLRQLTLRLSGTTGQLMVIVQFGEDNPEAIADIMGHIQATFPQIDSLNYVVNLKRNETIFDQEVICYAGQTYIEERMEDLSFRIQPKSFYQTNSLQAYKLYQIARELANLQGHEMVYDLYTGTGTIAQFIAKKAKMVVGIDNVGMAIEDAWDNARRNGISNVHFEAGDMKDVMTPAYVEQHGKPDVIITDPPRAGMHEDVVNTIIQAAPQRIVYVSCNPATQARDLALLDPYYYVDVVQPVDMFPHTHHVENVVSLIKRD